MFFFLDADKCNTSEVSDYSNALIWIVISQSIWSRVIHAEHVYRFQPNMQCGVWRACVLMHGPSLVFNREHECTEWMEVWFDPQRFVVSIEDRMPKLADIISVHHSCRVSWQEFECYSVWHCFPDWCSLLIPSSSLFVHKAYVSCRVSLSWQHKLFLWGEYHGDWGFVRTESFLYLYILTRLDWRWRITQTREGFVIVKSERDQKSNT